MDVYLQGQRIRLLPKQSIGKGGEADVYLVNGQAVKVYKRPDHPDLQGLPLEQKAAELRIREQQKKLRAFPKGLPLGVIIPEEVVTDVSGQRILGYTMDFVTGAEPLIRYADKTFRAGGISSETVVKVFTDLHRIVGGLHNAKVVIGDFNDLNVLVLGETAKVIDADSFQFGQFFCRMFTTKFVDPLLCDPVGKSFSLARPYQPDSDWYSYAVMLMQCLLFVDPYGGVYLPKNPVDKLTQGERPLHRVTVFHPEVRYPKPALPYNFLPDDLLARLEQIFVKDSRGEFPLQLVQTLRWTKCSSCTTVHARNVCPSCTLVTPSLVKQTTTVRGNVMVTEVFRTDGVILFAASQSGKLRWLYWEKDSYKRENGSEVLGGQLDPQMRYRIQTDMTLLGKSGQVALIKQGKSPERLYVDSFGNLPIFDANSKHRYWTANGWLVRDETDLYGSEQKVIGQVLSNQTLFWVGEKFGFGFYRAGAVSVAFVFDSESLGLDDSVKLPSFTGQIVDTTCVFASERCWFFVSTREGPKTINYCFVINRKGEIEATTQAEAGDDSWLGTIRGKTASGRSLFNPTDVGIVSVELVNGLFQERHFPDTEDFVDSSMHLFPDKEGIYVVSSKQVRLLKIN